MKRGYSSRRQEEDNKADIKKRIITNHGEAITRTNDQEQFKSNAMDGKLQNYINNTEILKRLKVKGIEKLFPIQSETFHSIQSGKDIIGKDRTGSGKTLAFTLPVLQKGFQQQWFDKTQKRTCQFLIILPTRQLTIQVATQIKHFSTQGNQLKVVMVYGGSDAQAQIQAIKSGVDIIVATPGRLIDLLNRGAIKLNKLKTICLDEADEMLKQGFQQDVQKIFQYIKDHGVSSYQTLLFSATIPEWVNQLSIKYQKEDKQVFDMIKKSSSTIATSTTVTHYKVLSNKQDKESIVLDLIQYFAINNSDVKDGRVIIFTETKREADQIGGNYNLGDRAGILHGDIPQFKRQRIFRKFKSGQIKCIVATNVAARGLDFPQIVLVIQLQPPKNAEDYIHRSGRTGRAGKKGVSVMLYSQSEQYLLKRIENQAKITFKNLKKAE